MADIPSPLVPPVLRDDLPRYPPLIQLLRVTAATVPGPAGNVLYVSSTQQLRTDTLIPRDREPCLALDVNMAGLIPGYYLGRLAGSYQSLPVYEVVGAESGATVPMPSSSPSSSAPVSMGALLGLTAGQVNVLTGSMTPSQLNSLINLNPCQLQTLVQLPITDIIRLTDTLTPTQMTLLVDNLTLTQLLTFVTTTTRDQTIVVTSAFPQLYQFIAQSLTVAQANLLFRTLTSQQDLDTTKRVVHRQGRVHLSPRHYAEREELPVAIDVERLVTPLLTRRQLPSPGEELVVGALGVAPE